MEVNDVYTPLRKVLPNNSRLGFVFDVPSPKEQTVFYLNGPFKVYQAVFDGKSIADSNPALEAMMDDGLALEQPEMQKPSHRTGTNRNLGLEQLNAQFRAITGTDEILLGLFNNQKPGRDTRIAVGIEVVFVRVPYRGDQIIDRKDWELGDQAITLLKDYPVMSSFPQDKDLKFDTDNCRHVLIELTDLFQQAPRTKLAQKIVSNTWATLNYNLEVLQYHDSLSGIFSKFSQVSKSYLVGG